MINEMTARAVLFEAQKSGADYAELYLEDKESTQIEMLDGKVETANYTRVCGAGVRVLRGTQSAYAYCADFSEKAMMETARAAAAALGEAKHAPQNSVVYEVKRYGGKMARAFDTVGNAERVELLREAALAAKGVSDEISQVQARYIDVVQRVAIVSTDGVFVFDERPRTRVFVQAVAMKNGEAQTGFESPGSGRGFEAYRETVDVADAGRVAGNMAVTMLHAPDCPAGYLPVVIDGGFGGVIFHEACGHSLEATAVGRNNSVFCGKLGTKIAADCVSAVDDGTMPGEWGSISVDDEGTPGQRNVLIENGILKGYLIDKLGSRRMGGMPVTGSSRRQGYTYAPTSRMTNTFICPGTDDEEEMIATMEEGLFAKKMGGGSVNPPTGEFNFVVEEGYWVKHGKIVSPVRGATLIGKGSEVLQKIDRVGKTMWMSPGMCGSLSGSVPTNVGQPRLRVSGITIGGRGGAIE